MTTEKLPLTYTEAIIAVSGRDPALAALLMHHHDCLEVVKIDVQTYSNEVALLAKRFDGFSKLAWSTMLTACGTLIFGLATVLWAVFTHPHGFAL